MPQVPPQLMHFLAMDQEDDSQKVHAHTEEVQVANLRAALDHYDADKDFRHGDIVRERQGLMRFKDNPVMLFVRMLRPRWSLHDRLLLRDAIHRNPAENHIDCIIARTTDTGVVLFMPQDSNLLERVGE